MKIFYFTATGNSLSVAKSLARDIYSMPKLLKEENGEFEDDVIGFVFPCYRGSIPTVVEEFIVRNKFKANYIFAIMTYGNISMAGMDHFQQIAQMNGLTIDYANEVKMVDTSLKYYDMDKQVESIGKNKVNEKIKLIRRDIGQRVTRNGKGNFVTRFLSRRGYDAYRKETGDCDKLFTVENHCTGCKTCEKVCPVDNIGVDGGVEFKGQCIRCYACTQNCPVNAIRFKGEKSKTRYRNPDVRLNEIIDANF